MRVGCIQYASEQGLGILAKSFYDAGVITDMMVFRHGSRKSHMEWYPSGTMELVDRPFNGSIVEGIIKDVDVMLFFETPHDWSVLDLCRRLKTPTVLVPMYECTPIRTKYCADKVIVPSLLDLQYYPGSTFIPIPVPDDTFELRTKANMFLHNAGNIGLRKNKGTMELMQAMPYVKSDLRLHIRAQDVGGLKSIISQVPRITQDPRVSFQFGSIPYHQLYTGYDVLVAPEKVSGLCLPIQEARAAGMVVMASDRHPHNTWLPKESLIHVSAYQQASMGGPYHTFDEAVLDPRDIASCMDALYGTDITSYSQSSVDWAASMSWSTLKPVWMEALSL